MTQAQLTLDGLPDPPRIGEWLRYRETREWARVEHVAVAGEHHGYGVPLRHGDVVMWISAGRSRVSSGPPFFWTRWERVDLDDAAREAMRAAAEVGLG